MHVQWQSPVFITSYLGCHHPPTTALWQPVPSTASLKPEARFWDPRVKKEAACTQCHLFSYLGPRISTQIMFPICHHNSTSITISGHRQSSWANVFLGKRNMLRSPWVSLTKLGKGSTLCSQHWHRKPEQAGVQPLVILPSAAKSELCYFLPPNKQVRKAGIPKKIPPQEFCFRSRIKNK